MISSGVTPFLGVSITSTAVVFGTATLGAPEAPPDCECAKDAAGRAAITRGITNFIGLSFRFRPVRFLLRVDPFLQLTMGLHRLAGAGNTENLFPSGIFLPLFRFTRRSGVFCA